MYRLHLQNTYDFEITNAKTNQLTICQEAQQAISFSLSMIHISSFLKKKGKLRSLHFELQHSFMNVTTNT